MFKAGDDLRQDQLVLLVLRVMDALWRREGLDLQVCAYDCVATGPSTGVLMMVPQSATVAAIVEAGLGAAAASAKGVARKLAAANEVFKPDRIARWLDGKVAEAVAAGHNPSLASASRAQAVETFARSAAAACVATYVMGIGDRHADNIMVTCDGRLFHIDFGHILGHFKYKMGIKRERSAFVWTPQMAAVLDAPHGAAYARFLDYGCRAFCVLRRHAALIVTLFNLMVGCGLPELQVAEEVAWLRGALVLDKSEQEAAELWPKLVDQCLNTRSRQLDDAIHLFVHA